MRLRTIPAASAGLLLVTSCSLTETPSSSGYPAQSISIIVPVPAGSSTDLSTRVLAPCLGQQLKATIVVENREGGSGGVGNGVFALSSATRAARTVPGAEVGAGSQLLDDPSLTPPGLGCQAR